MNEAEALISIVNDVELAEQHWDELPGVLKLLTVLRHPELTERMWEVLPESLRSFAIWSNDDTRATMVRHVINDYVGQSNQQNQQNNNLN